MTLENDVHKWMGELVKNASDPKAVTATISRLKKESHSVLVSCMVNLIPLLHELRSTMIYFDIPHKIEWIFDEDSFDHKTENDVLKWTNILFSEQATNQKEIEALLKKHNYSELSNLRLVTVAIIMLFVTYLGTGDQKVKKRNAKND